MTEAAGLLNYVLLGVLRGDDVCACVCAHARTCMHAYVRVCLLCFWRWCLPRENVCVCMLA